MRRTLAVVALLVCFCSALLAAKNKPKYQQAAPIHLDHDGERWAERTLKKMSLEEKVGQMFMVWAKAEFVNVHSPEYQRLR